VKIYYYGLMRALLFFVFSSFGYGHGFLVTSSQIREKTLKNDKLRMKCGIEWDNDPGDLPDDAIGGPVGKCILYQFIARE
jgi:hypothetical protein